MTLHFVRLILGDKTYRAKVSTEGCSDVDDFRGAIKIKLSPLLDSYATAQLTLLQPDGITEIDPETPVSELKEIPSKPMVVTVDELPIKVKGKQSILMLRYHSSFEVISAGTIQEAQCGGFLQKILGCDCYKTL